MNTQKRITIVFATILEAEPFICMTNAVLILRDPWPVYQTSISGRAVTIIITGMGMQTTGIASKFFIENYPIDMILNCGVAGSLTSDFVVGDIVNITDSWISKNNGLQKDICHLSAHTFSLRGYKDGVLLTVDKPVFDPVRRKILSADTQLVDMEGGIIARICERNNIPCQLIKIISDDATERKQLKRNLHKVSKILADNLVSDITRLFNQEMVA